ncbi:MAG: hypothetical protein J0H99_22190, partial [Rhodospirillales bacterium]|nr:hypothetical protein [Rhodospirillales bacterium]
MTRDATVFKAWRSAKADTRSPSNRCAARQDPALAMASAARTPRARLPLLQRQPDAKPEEDRADD